MSDEEALVKYFTNIFSFLRPGPKGVVYISKLVGFDSTTINGGTQIVE